MATAAPPRTFHHRDFDADDLVRRKDGRSIAVVIPARNEEATVAGVITAARAAAGGALVDEVVVVDGRSRDATATTARAAGARVVHQPTEGGRPAGGKGEALWHGLAHADGDLVAFLDADVSNPSPRFVTGLVGPLLTQPDIRFTKATYDRPLRTAGHDHAAAGGRVTELLARPLLAAFWPELAWLAQPLSGEYAGDRALLASLPFVTGYGVELALLADIAHRFGADVIGQVDLEERIHRNQPLDALGRMAAEILQVAVTRLEASGRILLTERPSPLLPQPVRGPDGSLGLRESTVAWREMPPLAGFATAGHRPRST